MTPKIEDTISKPSDFDDEPWMGRLNELAADVSRLVALLDDVRHELDATKSAVVDLGNRAETGDAVRAAALLSAWIEFELRRTDLGALRNDPVSGRRDKPASIL